MQKGLLMKGVEIGGFRGVGGLRGFGKGIESRGPNLVSPAVRLFPSINIIQGSRVEGSRVAMSPRAKSFARDFTPIKISRPEVKSPVGIEISPISIPKVDPRQRVSSVLEQASAVADRAINRSKQERINRAINRLRAPGYQPAIDTGSVIAEAQKPSTATIVARIASKSGVEGQALNLVQVAKAKAKTVEAALPSQRPQVKDELQTLSSDAAQLVRTQKAFEAAGLTTRTITQAVPKEVQAKAVATRKKVREEKNTRDNEEVKSEKLYHVVEWIVQKRRKLDIRAAITRVWERVQPQATGKKILSSTDIGKEIPQQYRAVKSSIVSDIETDGSHVQLKEDFRSSVQEFNSVQEAAVAGDKIADNNTAVTIDRNGKRVSPVEVAKVKQPNVVLAQAISTEIVVETTEKTPPVTETKTITVGQEKEQPVAQALPDIGRIINFQALSIQKLAA